MNPSPSPVLVEFTTATAPWWYVALLAGGFTVLGALITWIGSFALERLKSRRERVHKWDAEVVAHVSKGIAATITMRRCMREVYEAARLQRVSNLDGMGIYSKTATLRSFPQYVDAEEAYGVVLTELGMMKFIGPKPIYDACGEVIEKASALMYDLDLTNESWLTIRVGLNDANDKLRTVTRQHFGV